MVLVFLLLVFIIIILLVIFGLSLSNVKINIKKLHILYNEGKVKITFESFIEIYLLNKFNLIKYRIDDAKIRNLYNSGKININKFKYSKNININIIKAIKRNGFELEKIILEGVIGTEDAALTAYVSSIISIIVSILIVNKMSKYKKEDYYYNIDTIYINQNIINILFNCIISIKVVHIINIIFNILKKGRVNKYERASNRRTYANSNE